MKTKNIIYIHKETLKLRELNIFRKKNKKSKTSTKTFLAAVKIYKFKIIIILILLLLFITIKYYKINNKFTKNNKFFFFEKNQDELNNCINYGLMIYNYYNKEYMTNIGDYIQSLAALQYLPKNCKPYLIYRDKVQYYNGTKVKLLMNGWHSIKEGSKYISNQIIPIFLSYHINNPKRLPSIYYKNLGNFSEIGCRDTNTRNELFKHGIKAYFSSCLTTTLDIDYSAKDEERTNDIIFTDYKFGSYSKADKFIRSLKAYNFSKIIKITHNFKPKLTHIERFNLAKKLLDKYARAKLVITTRLHAALPCLALKTPVILINKNFDIRFSGLYKFLNTIGKNEQKKFEIKVNIDNKGFVYNSKKYLNYSIKLKEALKNF